MRKQTKIAAVVSAAALLALGASITSFAASKGTWMLVDGEWYCYDKNGDVYENTFCSSNGKEYYVGEDGMIVKSDWVEYDGSYYFVNSSGAKITNDWRLTTPYDDEDGDEAWFYFQSTGKRAENKKVVWKGNTFFFDAEGKMLTGWVTANGTEVVNEENSIDPNDTYYCGEDGARIQDNWVYTTEPTAEDDEADADEYYYYLKPNGNPVVNKKRNNVKGQSYIFDDEGRMLWGWIAKVEASGSDAVYEKIDEEEDTDVELSNFAGTDDEVYYCSGEDDGHVKKNKWIKTWKPAKTYEEDEDEDKFWYWIEKDGKIYIPKEADASASAWKYKFEEGQLVEDTHKNITTKKINSKDYYFNADGEMISGFQWISFASDSNANGMYYFGGSDDGSMKTGSQTVKDDNGDSYKFYFGTRTATNDVEETKGRGITGNKSNKLYFDGMLIKAEDYKYQVAVVNGLSYIINQNGSIQHAKSEYKEDGDVLIDAKGADVKFVTTNEEITAAGGTPFKYSVNVAELDNRCETIIAADVVYEDITDADKLPDLH